MKFSLSCQKKYFLSETSWSQQRTIFANSSFSQVTRWVIFTQWSKKRSRYGHFFLFEAYKYEKGKWPTFLCFEAFRNLFQIEMKPMKQQQNLALINQSSPTRLYFSNLKWPVSDFQKKKFRSGRLLRITCFSFSVANTDHEIENKVLAYFENVWIAES